MPVEASSPAQPEELRALESQISALREEQDLQMAILQSLADLPQNENVQKELLECRSEIERTKTELSTVRRAHYSATKAAAPRVDTHTTMSNKTKRMQPQSQSHPFPTTGSGFGVGSSFGSDSGSGSGSGAASLPRSSTPSRKRPYSLANVTPTKSHQPGSRARHKSPSPQAGDNSPSGSSVIDLTGDDNEFYEHMRERKRNNEQKTGLDGRNAAATQPAPRYGFPYTTGPSSHGPYNHGGQSASRSLGDYGGYGGSFGSQSAMSRASQPETNTPARHIGTQASQPTYGFGASVPPPTITGNRAAGSSYGGHVQNLPQRPAHQIGLPLPGTQGGSQQHSSSRFGEGFGLNSRMPGAYPEFSKESESRRHSRNIISIDDDSPTTYPGSTGAALAAQRAALARQYFPDQYIPGYTPKRDMVHSPYSAYRPGYVDNGMSGYSQGQGSSFVSGSSFLRQDMHGASGSLSSIIGRTNGYDFHAMTDENGNPLDSRLTNYYNDLIEDPRKTAEELKQLISNIRPDMEIPMEERGDTPEALKYPLYPHQQLALKWMTDMERGPNKGGILADDMGLGKTISTLSLMITNKATDGIKTNLIVGPVALIKQWEVEIHKKLKPEHRLSVFLLHAKKLEYSQLKQYDVVLTTFGLLAQEWRRFNKRVLDRKDDPRYHAYDDVELHKTCPLVHPKSKFWRVILDEAQNIKNKDAQASKGAELIEAKHRWCLTGTPMMNSVQELYPLIRFLKIRPYSNFTQFQRHFSVLTAKKQKLGHEQSSSRALKQLRVVLKAIMLRRMKNSEIDGKPILTLPPKTEHIHNCVFSPEEQSFYKGLESKSRITFNKYLRQGTVSKNYAHVLVLLLRLRQACCHPHLNLDFDYATAADSTSEDAMALMEEFAKSLDAAVVERLKAAEAFECPICFDAVEDPTIFVPCGHDTCSECFTALTENSRQANSRADESGEVAVKCPECRGSVYPKKVISYMAFRKIHMPETIVAPPPDMNAVIEEDDDESTDDSDSEFEDSSDDDADEYGDLRDFVVRDDVSAEVSAQVSAEVSDEDKVGSTEDDDDEFPEVAAVLGAGPSQMPKKAGKTGKAAKSKKAKTEKKKGKGKSKADEVKPHMLKTLRIEAGKNQEARRKYMKYLKKNWESSAKVTKICEILKDIEPSGEKTIIFSQWTSLLDLLEIPMKYDLKIKYRRYDGGMSRNHRDESIRQFVEDPRVKVLLVSLRAGNAGLNLTAASHVIICDPFWNPFVEMQAVDRAHRIGQLRPVHVHRVVVKSKRENEGEGAEPDETVEDRILALQEKKRLLINGALDEGESRSLGRLSEQDLVRLFGN